MRSEFSGPLSRKRLASAGSAMSHFFVCMETPYLDRTWQCSMILWAHTHPLQPLRHAGVALVGVLPRPHLPRSMLGSYYATERTIVRALWAYGDEIPHQEGDGGAALVQSAAGKMGSAHARARASRGAAANASFTGLAQIV